MSFHVYDVKKGEWKSSVDRSQFSYKIYAKITRQQKTK